MLNHLRTAARIFRGLTVFVLLTFISQVGGVVYIVHLILMKWFRVRQWYYRFTAFTVLYLAMIIIAVPPLAKMNGRVPLPAFMSEKVNVRPHSVLLSLTCRHYVRPELKEMLLAVASDMEEKYPGIVIEYLDANFPLMKEFRMYPHIQHDDGRKLDIAYIRRRPSGEYAYKYFSLFGYGYSIKPVAGETDKPAECGSQGYWQYNIIENYVPDQLHRGHTFPVGENRHLLESIASHPAVKYVIVEPHIKERVGLTAVENIRNLGCWAIRHDDHIHVAAY